MATPNIVPRADGEGGIGTISKVWGKSYFRSSSLADPDVSHGCTNVAETTVYGNLSPIHGTQGGLYINGISDQESASARSLALRGICNDTHTDTVPTVEIIGAKRSGVTVQALAAAETVLTIANHTTVLTTVLGDGKTTFTGAIASTNYRTIYIDAAAMVPSVTNGAAAGTEELDANKPTVDYFAFDKDTDEYVQFKLAMPPEWDRGTVRARYYWKPSDGDTGTLVWALEGITYAHDFAFMGTAFGTPAAADAQAATVDNDLIITLDTGTAACTIQDTHAADNMVLFRITRDTSADDYDADAHLLGVAIQYKESNSNAEEVWT